MIVPLVQKPGQQAQTTSKVQIDQNMDDEWSVDMSSKQKPDLIKAQGDSQTAKISLSDCLACSGCVTSAETVLIQKHSTDEFLKLFDQGTAEKPNFVVVALSPQSIASLSLYYKDTNDLITFKKLQEIFHKLGSKIVIDLSLFSLLSLTLSYEEFKRVFLKSKRYQDLKEEFSLPNQNSEQVHQSENEKVGNQIPLLSSECPGWVCYAEKVVGEGTFPNMSQVKSPQQLGGSLLKHYLSMKYKISPQQVKIVTVMPCYDKKLEAVRPNFTLQEDQDIDDGDVKEVDTVLASHELVDLFKSQDIDFSKTQEYQWTQQDIEMLGSPSGWGFMEIMEQFVEACANVKTFTVTSILNRTSNGYLEYIFRRTARELFSIEIDPSQSLEYIQGKNKDLKEIVLNIEGKTVLRFASSYGFRNIQNVIRNIKRGKSQYDYVELMACPGGCLNGGGQIKPKDLNISPKEALEQLEYRMYNMEQRNLQPFPQQDPSLNKLLTMMSITYSNWSNTTFHAIPKEIVSAHNMKW